jgi:REP element-mobilizing transposase RayT
MKAAAQDSLPGLNLTKRETFGGSALKSHPKEQRPIPLDRPIQIVMRSKYAIKSMSFRRKALAERVWDIIRKQSERFNVRIYQYGNGGNHLHLMVSPRSRRGYRGFIRAVTGLIAREVTGAQRNNAVKVKFWDARPFTRIVSWGRDFKQLSEYLVQNTLEAFGFIEYQSRGHGAGFVREWKVRGSG